MITVRILILIIITSSTRKNCTAFLIKFCLVFFFFSLKSNGISDMSFLYFLLVDQKRTVRYFKVFLFFLSLSHCKQVAFLICLFRLYTRSKRYSLLFMRYWHVVTYVRANSGTTKGTSRIIIVM